MIKNHKIIPKPFEGAKVYATRSGTKYGSVHVFCDICGKEIFAEINTLENGSLEVKWLYIKDRV